MNEKADDVMRLLKETAALATIADLLMYWSTPGESQVKPRKALMDLYLKVISLANAVTHDVLQGDFDRLYRMALTRKR